MSALGSIYLKKETLKKLSETTEKGVEITISIDDKSNDYGQNVSAYLSQTQEQRTNKAKKTYVGNGKIFWTNGKITTAVKKQDVAVDAEVVHDDLPF